MQVQFKVNGKATAVDVPPHTLLVQVLREHLKLTGTHVGCDTAQCGACTVIKDGRAIKSCNVLVAQAAVPTPNPFRLGCAAMCPASTQASAGMTAVTQTIPTGTFPSK